MSTLDLDLTWVCQTVREMFWNGDSTWDECHRIFESCFPDDSDPAIRDHAIIAILEGRQTIRDGALVEETGPIRSIAEKIRMQESQLTRMALLLDMQRDPIKYVDTAMPGYSLRTLPSYIGEPITVEDVWTHRTSGIGSLPMDHPMSAGMYLFEDEALAFAILQRPCISSEEVMEKLYTYWQDARHLTTVPSEWRQAIQARQESWEAHLRQHLHRERWMTTLLDEIRMPSATSPSPLETPDDLGSITTSYGWIDPEGRW